LERLLVLPRHPRQYSPLPVPNLSIRPSFLHPLICPRIDVGRGRDDDLSSGRLGLGLSGRLHFVLDPFAFDRHLANELLVWARRVTLAPSALGNPAPFFVAPGWLSGFFRSDKGVAENRRLVFCLWTGLGFGLVRFLVLPRAPG